jgi:hypothetical protein
MNADEWAIQKDLSVGKYASTMKDLRWFTEQSSSICIPFGQGMQLMYTYIQVIYIYIRIHVYIYICIYIHTYPDWGSSMNLSGSWYGSTRKSNAQHPGLMSSNDDLQHGLSLTMAPRWAPFSMAMHHVFLQIRQRYHTYEKYWYVLILCIDKYWYVHCQTIINNHNQYLQYLPINTYHI